MKIIKLLAIMGIFKIATKGASEKQYLKSHFFFTTTRMIYKFYVLNNTHNTVMYLEIYVENVPETITQC